MTPETDLLIRYDLAGPEQRGALIANAFPDPEERSHFLWIAEDPALRAAVELARNGAAPLEGYRRLRASRWLDGASEPFQISADLAETRGGAHIAGRAINLTPYLQVVDGFFGPFVEAYLARDCGAGLVLERRLLEAALEIRDLPLLARAVDPRSGERLLPHLPTRPDTVEILRRRRERLAPASSYDRGFGVHDLSPVSGSPGFPGPMSIETTPSPPRRKRRASGSAAKPEDYEAPAEVVSDPGLLVDFVFKTCARRRHGAGAEIARALGHTRQALWIWRKPGRGLPADADLQARLRAALEDPGCPLKLPSNATAADLTHPKRPRPPAPVTNEALLDCLVRIVSSEDPHFGLASLTRLLAAMNLPNTVKYPRKPWIFFSWAYRSGLPKAHAGEFIRAAADLGVSRLYDMGPIAFSAFAAARMIEPPS